MTPDEWRIALSLAIDDLGSLKFFPQAGPAQDAIYRLLERMVTFGRVDQLTWLVQTMVDRVGQWNGPVELRGVFCTHFKAADGIEADCELTGSFTAAAMETRSVSKNIALPRPEARALLAGIVESNDSDDIQAIIDSIARMPGPQPNKRGERNSRSRTDKERELITESIQQQIKPERRRTMSVDQKAAVANFYRNLADNLDGGK